MPRESDRPLIEKMLDTWPGYSYDEIGWNMTKEDVHTAMGDVLLAVREAILADFHREWSEGPMSYAQIKAVIMGES